MSAFEVEIHAAIDATLAADKAVNEAISEALTDVVGADEPQAIEFTSLA